MCIRDSSQSVVTRTDAWLGDFRAPPPRIESDAADSAGVDLSRVAPARAAWLGRGRMGAIRQQPEREVLRAHEARSQAALGRVRRVGTAHDGGSIRPRDEVAESA